MKIESVADLIKGVRVPRSIRLDCSGLNKGNDNFHVDVQLSDDFIFQMKEVTEDQVKKAIAGRRLDNQTADGMTQLRTRYTEMMTAALHRIEVDLTPDQFNVSQFAVPKVIIMEVRFRLGEYASQLNEAIAQQQQAGSRGLLTTQERATEFRRQYADLHYGVCRHLFRNLQRADSNHLKQLRGQYLFDKLPEGVILLFNPMLCAMWPDDDMLLMDNYGFWDWGAKDFNTAVAGLEDLLAMALGSLPVRPLQAPEKADGGPSEVFDELRGLFASQPFLGRAEDQSDKLSAAFCWLDEPGNVRLLFDENLHDEAADALKEEQGYKAWWGFRSDLKKLSKVVAEAKRRFAPDPEHLRMIIGGHILGDEWNEKFSQNIDVAQACRYVAGIDAKKIPARMDQGNNEGRGYVLDNLNKFAELSQRRYKDELSDVWLQVLTDLSRYRLHLHYYRLAHRVFNRLNVLTDPDEIQLSRSGGNSYHLLNDEETRERGEVPDNQVIHHSIMKADVRGAMRVTSELTKQNLNPAAYFSSNFFEPLNRLLEIYGATKVLVEGDAVTLCQQEYSASPGEWYCVARGCGLAREMIDIGTARNAASRKIGLPALELGIGISHLPERPLFLVDEERPIMISAAIGDADRIATSNKMLRDKVKPAPFAVQVIASESGARTQHNVNGVLLSNDSFRKLGSEIQLRLRKVTMLENEHTFYVGRYPDQKGKERDLVIREGAVARVESDSLVTGKAGITFMRLSPAPVLQPTCLVSSCEVSCETLKAVEVAG